MKYIGGYLIPVRAGDKEAYRNMATIASISPPPERNSL